MLRKRSSNVLANILAIMGLMCGGMALADYADSFHNVKSFGAAGNGSGDDTEAIQAAFDAGRKAPYKPVLFPRGSYVISDTIISYGLNFMTDGSRVTVTQKNPEKDIFFIEFAWRGTVEKFSFNGGAKQLNMGNPNTDTGLVIVKNCEFKDSNDFAIYWRQGSNSTQFILRDCSIVKCEQVLHTWTDNITFKDSWVTTAWMNNKAAIENRHGKLFMENILGVPLVTGRDDRWIDNYGSITARNFRFGGEFGGMTAIWNFSRGGIILEDCYIGAQGSGKMAAVYAKEIPNVFVIRDCHLTVPPVLLTPEIDLDTYFNHIPEGSIRIDLLNNTGFYDRTVVNALIHAVENRDTSPALEGQMSLPETAEALNLIAQRIRAVEKPEYEPVEFEGHRQKLDPDEYVELTANAVWDLDDYMDATPVKNSEIIANIQVGGYSVFMRRLTDAGGASWPHAFLRNVEIDLGETPFLSWKQLDPGDDPLPEVLKRREEENNLPEGHAMPSGYALRVIDKETQRMVLLHETHHKPWFDYRAKDLRKLFDVEGGKRTFDIKYYPLGNLVYHGAALPGEYQILEFVRAEKE